MLVLGGLRVFFCISQNNNMQINYSVDNVAAKSKLTATVQTGLSKVLVLRYQVGTEIKNVMIPAFLQYQ